MTIYFDMDGTIANLYQVEDWLPKLRASDPSPYADAKPMLNLRLLARYLNRLQRKGYKLGVISWLSKESDANYSEVVRIRKMRWLKTHMSSVKWDEIHLVKYGRPKHYVAQDKNRILFDDNLEIRKEWGEKAYAETEIFSTLKELL